MKNVKNKKNKKLNNDYLRDIFNNKYKSIR